MSIKLPAESPIGPYDRNQLFVVTFPDCTQKFYPRKAKSSYGQISPLSWWRKCGIFSDERDQWSKSVMHPEHVQIMKQAGIAPGDLFNTLLSPADVEDVLAWFNIFRKVYERTPKTLFEFKDFVKLVESCTGYRTKNPVSIGKYIAKVRHYRIGFDEYSFAMGNDAWLNAICSDLDDVPHNLHLASTVKTLMQVGATPEAIAALVVPTVNGMKAERYGYCSKEAIIQMFTAGEFSASAESYAATRLLAEAMSAAPQSSDCIKKIFFATGTDRQRLRNLIVVDGVIDAFRLTAIFAEGVPTALVGGFL